MTTDTTKEDWCSEIADVIICAWQLSRLAGIDIETQLQKK